MLSRLLLSFFLVMAVAGESHAWFSKVWFKKKGPGVSNHRPGKNQPLTPLRYTPMGRYQDSSSPQKGIPLHWLKRKLGKEGVRKFIAKEIKGLQNNPPSHQPKDVKTPKASEGKANQELTAQQEWRLYHPKKSKKSK